MTSSTARGESSPSFSGDLDPSRLNAVRDLRRISGLIYPVGLAQNHEGIGRFIMHNWITQAFAQAIQENTDPNCSEYPTVSAGDFSGAGPYFYASLNHDTLYEPSRPKARIYVAERLEGMKYDFSIPILDNNTLDTDKWEDEGIGAKVNLTPETVAPIGRYTTLDVSKAMQFLWALRRGSASLASVIESRADSATEPTFEKILG